MKISVLSGPYEGSNYDFDYDIIIGRDPSVDLAFPLDLSISRKHLKLSFKQNLVIVEDLNSTNGTFVIQKGNIERIQGKKEINSFPLFLKIGNSLIQVEL